MILHCVHAVREILACSSFEALDWTGLGACRSAGLKCLAMQSASLSYINLTLGGISHNLCILFAHYGTVHTVRAAPPAQAKWFL